MTIMRLSGDIGTNVMRIASAYFMLKILARSCSIHEYLSADDLDWCKLLTFIIGLGENPRDMGICGVGVGWLATWILVYFMYRFRCFFVRIIKTSWNQRTNGPVNAHLRSAAHNTNKHV